jgi:hypothetical protein
MLAPNQTATRAVSGGFSVPNDEYHTKKIMHPIHNITRIIQPRRLHGRGSRGENKAETIANASPIKKDQRTPIDKIAKPAINKI